MQPSDIDTVLTNGEVADNWVVGGCMPQFEKETPFGSTLHKMSQDVTVLLNLLELAQMTGEVEPGDIISMLEAARQLRDHIKTLRANNVVISNVE